MIKVIAAMDERNVIGSGGQMPWHVPQEYAHFLEKVSGNIVIMGRKSFDEFGHDLTHTKNIVLSRRIDVILNATVCHSIGEALSAAQRLRGDIFCAGGGEIYRQMVPLAEVMMLSRIRGKFTGDVFFPVIDLNHWCVRERLCFEEYDYVEYVLRRHTTDNSR